MAGAGWRQVSLICDDEKVLLIGECIEPCGFVDDIRARIGSQGEIKVIDITDEAHNYLAKKRDRGGQLATWQWAYTRNIADGTFDSVACLQGCSIRTTGVLPLLGRADQVIE